MPYFDLKFQRSYKAAGPSLQRYAFYKGKPVLVENEADASKFRNQNDTFIEVNENGEPIVEEIQPDNTKSYRKFRQSNLPTDPEELLQKTFEEAVQKRESEGVNVDEILKQASDDIQESDAIEEESDEVEDDKKEEKLEKVEKVKKPKKKDPLQCAKCNRKFKNKKELEAHLDDHENED